MLFFCERAQYLYCKQWSCIFHRNLRYTFTITGNSQNPDWITWERPFGARISLYLCVCACMHLALSQLCEIDRITHNPRITPAKGSEEMFFLYCNKNVSRSKSVIVKSLKRERGEPREDVSLHLRISVICVGILVVVLKGNWDELKGPSEFCAPCWQVVFSALFY